MAKRGKNRVVAAMLAIFGGSFGLHKFYLNDAGGGIFFIFIFFMTAGVFPVTAFLGFIEAIRLLSMSDDQFDRKYNRHVFREQRRPGTEEYRRYKQTQRAKHRNIPVQDRNPQRKARAVSRSTRSNPFKKSGIKKHKDFDLAAAIEDFKQGLQISPDDIALHFNIACSYSLTEQKEKAYHHLARAVQLGFDDLKRIESHDDLAYVRIQPEFEAFKRANYSVSPFDMTKGGGGRAENAAPQVPQDDKLLSQLNKLAELRKKGLLSEEEFMLERKKLMRR